MKYRDQLRRANEAAQLFANMIAHYHNKPQKPIRPLSRARKNEWSGWMELLEIVDELEVDVEHYMMVQFQLIDKWFNKCPTSIGYLISEAAVERFLRHIIESEAPVKKVVSPVVEVPSTTASRLDEMCEQNLAMMVRNYKLSWQQIVAAPGCEALFYDNTDWLERKRQEAKKTL